jgi:hypothetical protein
MATLYDYYTSKGQKLPTIQERAKIYEQQGLGSAFSYTGTAAQNTALLGKLQTPASPATPVTIGLPDKMLTPEANKYLAPSSLPTNKSAPTGATTTPAPTTPTVPPSTTPTTGPTGPAEVTGAGSIGVGGSTSSTVATGSSTTPTLTIPKELADNPYFGQLDPDNQAMVAYYWNITNSQNEDKKKAFQDALNLATEQADPYWREKINLVKDEAERAFGTLTADEASEEEKLSRRSQAIAEDLKYNKEYLTAEEQAELSRQKDDYDKQLLTIRENMATRGLTSSTISTQAHEQLATASENVIGSVQRQYAKKQRDLGVGAERDVADITAQLVDLKRKLGEGKTDVARKAETYLGSGTAAGIQGASSYLLGNVSGIMKEDKGTDILQRANALLGLSV